MCGPKLCSLICLSKRLTMQCRGCRGAMHAWIVALLPGMHALVFCRKHGPWRRRSRCGGTAGCGSLAAGSRTRRTSCQSRCRRPFRATPLWPAHGALATYSSSSELFHAFCSGMSSPALLLGSWVLKQRMLNSARPTISGRMPCLQWMGIC